MAAQTAAADDSGLRPLFENPLPEIPTLMEALSICHRNVHPNNKPIDPSSFTEIFGELHFHEKQSSQQAPVPPRPPPPPQTASSWPKPASTGESSASSLVLCTEALGSESTVDADGMLKVESTGGAAGEEEEEKRPLTTFPPPIRSIGPRVCFRSFRADGRLVVMEVVTPGRELLQASREGGRLRLQFASASAAAAGVVGVDEDMREDEDEDHDERAK